MRCLQQDAVELVRALPLAQFLVTLAAFTLLPPQQLVGHSAKSHDLVKLFNLRN